jgi:hypothetical protein
MSSNTGVECKELSLGGWHAVWHLTCSRFAIRLLSRAQFAGGKTELESAVLRRVPCLATARIPNARDRFFD